MKNLIVYFQDISYWNSKIQRFDCIFYTMDKNQNYILYKNVRNVLHFGKFTLIWHIIGCFVE